jgi:hypothetical protein
MLRTSLYGCTAACNNLYCVRHTTARTDAVTDQWRADNDKMAYVHRFRPLVQCPLQFPAPAFTKVYAMKSIKEYIYIYIYKWANLEVTVIKMCLIADRIKGLASAPTSSGALIQSAHFISYWHAHNYITTTTTVSTNTTISILLPLPLLLLLLALFQLIPRFLYYYNYYYYYYYY